MAKFPRHLLPGWRWPKSPPPTVDPIEQPVFHCPSCRGLVGHRDEACPHCGAKLEHR